MSPRIVLQSVAKPLLVAGIVWGTSAIGDALAAPGQTPPPCSPDGVCVPRPETFGWYQTRWRRFPGDRFGSAPTPAEADRPEAGETDDESLGGPQLPSTAEEARTGPVKPAAKPPGPGAGAAPPAAPAEGAPDGAPAAAPAAAPAEGPAAEAAPPAAQPADAPAPGPGPAAQPQPDLRAPPFGNPPADDLTDPFGPSSALPPLEPNQSAPQLVARPSVAATPQVIAAPLLPAAEVAQPVRQRASSVPSAPGDDAPPALPASLQRLSQQLPTTNAVTAAPISLPPLRQPTSVANAAQARAAQPQVAQVNYQAGSDVQLVNPAALTEPGDGSELEKAIYFEATDQSEQILRY